MSGERTAVGHSHRPEIDGLRALAVLPVMCFHAGVAGFGGGFVGVDVFFVISGFLICGIILAESRAGTFSYRRFYERRARRILPALVTVSLLAIVPMWVWMMPAQAVSFGQSLLAVAFFGSNILFWRTSDYFAAAAEEKPLLHTWSLGVEEQFYLFFPPLILLLLRLRPSARRVALWAAGLVSLVAAEALWRTGHSMANFFLLPTRAWELLIGAGAAMWMAGRAEKDRGSDGWADGFAATGLIAIVLSITWFDARTPAPSAALLLPTLGTTAVLLFARPGGGVTRLLSLRPLVAIGLISYSAYLWHQPVLAFARLAGADVGSSTVALAAIVGAILLAYPTWRFVETPMRDSRRVSRRAVLAVGGAGSVALVIAGAAIVLGAGFPSRIPPDRRLWIAYSDTDRNASYVTARARAARGDFPALSAKRVLVIGDSYAQDLLNVIGEEGHLSRWDVRIVDVPMRCQIVWDPRAVLDSIAAGDRQFCQWRGGLRAAGARIREADVIILSASWAPWAVDLLPATIDSMGLSASQRLLVVGRKHAGNVNLAALMRRPAREALRSRGTPSAEAMAVNDRLRAMLAESLFVDIQAAMCGDGHGCPLFTPDGALISYDGGHLTRDGAIFVGRALFAREPMVALDRSARR